MVAMKPAPLYPLTSIRFFAAGAIVVFHLSSYGLLPLGHLPMLANGVSLFFVLSGFILAYNYRDMSGGLWSFYVTRVARVWPLHVATIGLCFFLLPTAAVWATHPVGFHIFLANLFLVQSWVPTGAYSLSVNAVSWSISVEVFFYAMFPIAIGVKRPFLAAVLCTVATVAVAWCVRLGPETDPFALSGLQFVLHSPLMRLAEFLAGIATARAFLGHRQPLGGTLTEVTAIALAVASAALMDRFKSMGALGLWLSQCGSFPAFALLIYVLARGEGRISAALSNRMMVMLGEISFATYMVHQLVIRHAVQSQMASIWQGWAVVLTVIAATYAASYALFLLVEMPARAAIVRALVRGSYRAQHLVRLGDDEVRPSTQRQ